MQLVFPPSPRPPLITGVTGPKGIDVTARVADGLLLPEGSSPAYVRAALDRLGWPRGQTPMCVVYVLFSVDDDRALAHQRVRGGLDKYGPGGIDERLAKLGPVEHVSDDDRVARYAAAGTPHDCARSIERLLTAGATSVVIVPHAPDHTEQVDRLLTDVVPLLRP